MRALKRKRAAGTESDFEGTWAVSYGDMVTLLLTFFILFFSTSKDTQGHGKELQESLVIQLKSELTSQRTPLPDLKKQASDRQPASLDLGSTQGEGIEAAIEDQFGAKIHKVGEKVVIEFPGVSFYQFAQIQLTADGAKALDRFTHAFLPFAGNYDVAVRAYTDNRPVRHDLLHPYQDNIELSVMRALSALRHLQKTGIPLRRLKPGGFGELNFPEPEDSANADGTVVVKGVPLARKVVLVLEPHPKEGV